MIRCPECERLTNRYADIVNENAELLKEYHTALFARDVENVNRLGAALPAMEQFRKEAKAIMDEHRAKHEDRNADAAQKG